ncbi:uncharacterized protein RCO7_14907 [Rhynchosporium graminicola]|uniref:Uncharacterized protein n=1 Tax=Rhynchosporium graminicola TaxID=2792576 RepID=A0A1E1L9P3_9HELO|nr:uncharacterized protein RCO7_14907 [Rhynchosporium commune]
MAPLPPSGYYKSDVLLMGLDHRSLAILTARDTRTDDDVSNVIYVVGQKHAGSLLVTAPAKIPPTANIGHDTVKQITFIEL